ncbi:MAG: FAD-linked oxidase C-terminal domain-containing protein, partial [Thermoplasmatales archaeon]
MIPNHVVKEFVSVVGEKNVLVNEVEKIPYMYDASLFKGDMPEIVVLPQQAQEVSKILTICNSYKIPVTPRGGGTSLTGASVPIRGGIVLALSRMDKVEEISLEDNYVLVQAGTKIDDLNSQLSSYGYFFPPDPASSVAATVGGIISTNAGGLRGAKYGVVKDWVLGVEAVLPTGEVLKFGNKTLKHRIGYDLTSLIIGSEGTLAVVTRAYLKIWPLPEKIVRILAFFDTIDKVGEAIVKIKRSGIVPLMAEFIDNNYVNILKSSLKMEIPPGDNFVLLLDIDGPPEAIDRYLNKFNDILSSSGASEIKFSSDPIEMENLRSVRKGAGSVLLLMRKKNTETRFTSDVVVPPSQLPKFLKEVSSKIAQSNRLVPMLGHIGDGNIHAEIFMDLADPDDLEKALKLNEEIGMLALKYGGSISAEHGIGLEKKNMLISEYRSRNSEMALTIMKGIKKVLDPNN